MSYPPCDDIGQVIRSRDNYGILKGYNDHYGNVQLIETNGERYYIYSFDNQSWLIDAYELQCMKARNHTSHSRYNRSMIGHAYSGLDIRMDCHEYVEEKLRSNKL